MNMDIIKTDITVTSDVSSDASKFISTESSDQTNNNTTDSKTNDVEKANDAEHKDKHSTKQNKVIAVCDLCNKEIFITPILARLDSITGKASWNRNCSTDKLVLCTDCAKSLNDLIDNFVIKKNPNLNKFKLPKGS